MKNILDHAAKHIMNCTDCIVEARTALYEAEDSLQFKGNLADLRDRIDELNSILYDLNEVQSYIENIDIDF